MPTYDVIWESTITSLNHEWRAIYTAKGFGKSFSNWVLQILGWPAFPLAFPPIEIVEALEEAVKLAFQEKYNEDMKQHQHHKNFQKYVDHKHGYDRASYQPIREPPKQIIQSLNRHRVISCDLHRMLSDDLYQFHLGEGHDILVGDKVKIHGNHGHIVDADTNIVVVHFENTCFDFPSQVNLDTSKLGNDSQWHAASTYT